MSIWRRRIRRAEFAALFWPLWLLAVAIGGVVLARADSDAPVTWRSVLFVVLFFGGAFLFLQVLLFGRLRDLEWNPAFAILYFVPCVNWGFFLVLTFWPGTRGPNKYGDDPRPGRRKQEPATGGQIAAPQPPTEAPTRQCPYCAETIKAAAIVCRFCGRESEPENRSLYVLVGGTATGPFTEEEVLTQATSESLVSHGADWVRAGDHPLLVGRVPPPIPSVPSVDNAPGIQHVGEAGCGSEPLRGDGVPLPGRGHRNPVSGLALLFSLGAVAVAVLVVAFFVAGGRSDRDTDREASPFRSSQRPSLLQYRPPAVPTIPTSRGYQAEPQRGPSDRIGQSNPPQPSPTSSTAGSPVSPPLEVAWPKLLHTPSVAAWPTRAPTKSRPPPGSVARMPTEVPVPVDTEPTSEPTSPPDSQVPSVAQPSSPPAGESVSKLTPVRLTIHFDSPLRKGKITLTLDGEPFATIPFSFSRKGGGRIREVFTVPSGYHVIGIALESRQGDGLGEAAFTKHLWPGSEWTLRIDLSPGSRQAAFFLL